MPESEPTQEFFPFEDVTGTMVFLTESDIRQMGYFHRHSPFQLFDIYLRSDGSTATLPASCPICDFAHTLNTPWPEAWRVARLWAVTFESLAVIRRIEEEYAASVLVESSFRCNLPGRIAGLLEGSPPEAAG